MSDERLEKLIRENERMKAVLRSIRSLAERSTFGGWRFKIADLVDQGLCQ
jgi:hypothetical protein